MMEKLSDCRDRHNRISEHQREGEQILHFSAPEDWEYAVYQFSPHHFYPGDKSPDGLVLVHCPRRSPSSLVCFIELKTSSASANAQHAREQLEQGIAHFIPWKRCGYLHSHGDTHHERWGNTRDPLPLEIGADHRIWGMRIVWRQGGRSPAHFNPRRPVEVCGKEIRFVQLSLSLSKPRPVEVDLKTLFEKATIPCG